MQRFLGPTLLVLAVLVSSVSPVLGGGGVDGDTVQPHKPDAAEASRIEAMFPEGECDGNMWRDWNRQIDYSKHPEREKYPEPDPKLPGVCFDQQLNINLYGGTYFFGLYVAPPHPDHPHADKFGPATRWEPVDPIAYIPVLKARLTDPDRWQSWLNPDREWAWKKWGPCYKKAMLAGVLRMERGLMDLDQDGIDEMVYRDTLPWLRRKRADGTFGYLWHNYYIYDECPAKKNFNKVMWTTTGEPFKYDGTLYWMERKWVYENFYIYDAINDRRSWHWGAVCRSLE